MIDRFGKEIDFSELFMEETLSAKDKKTIPDDQWGLIIKNDSEYHLTHKGLRLNRILYEMASYGLDELECGEERELETIEMFKDYYKQILKVDDYESGDIE